MNSYNFKIGYKYIKYIENNFSITLDIESVASAKTAYVYMPKPEKDIWKQAPSPQVVIERITTKISELKYDLFYI